MYINEVCQMKIKVAHKKRLRRNLGEQGGFFNCKNTNIKIKKYTG